jgi:hypothetical protein
MIRLAKDCESRLLRCQATHGGRSSRRFVWVLACAAAAAAGCGGRGQPRYRLEGNVTYAGRPVPWGEVTFTADPASGESGPLSFAMIMAGRYETTRAQGVCGGPTLVRITGYDGPPAREGVLGDGRPLFKEWKTTIELPRADATADFEVPATATARP